MVLIFQISLICFASFPFYPQGDVPDELSARLVKNRGPITAKVMASGTHTRYCGNFDLNCDVQLSLVAWKFAGDQGTVHGHLIEEFSDAEVMKVDIDCMVRKDNAAIVGGVVTTAPEKHPSGKAKSRRAYVKVVANDDGEGSFVSNVFFDDGIDSNCRTSSSTLLEGLERFVEESSSNIVDPRVSVCSKHGDWENCLKKAKIEQAVV